MRYTIQEIKELIKANNINKVRTLLSLPQFEKMRTKMIGRTGRCFLYDFDEKLLNEFSELYKNRTKWEKKGEKLC